MSLILLLSIINNKIMKSLRTDDIHGARPKIRHAPRLLVRHQQSYEHPNYREPQYSNHLRLSQSVNQYSPLAHDHYKSQQLQHQQPAQLPKSPIMSKQMPRINYSLPPKESKLQPRREQPEEKPTVKPQIKKPDERIYSRRSQKSEKSIENKQQKVNIFRGLGYNIITNHRFSYDMVNNYKNSNSRWLPNP